MFSLKHEGRKDNMVTFLLGITALILGYVVYGRFVEKVFGVEESRETPAQVLTDGMDYVPMKKGTNALIELLNIAGTGPIFGPIMGVLYGPVAYIWIVVGCIFGGAVHDYMSGMISLRNNGANLPELTERYLGKKTKHIVNLFTAILIILVGTVFVITPAQLIDDITPVWLSLPIIAVLIYIYYFVSTFLPIDKAMGKIYPIFGSIMLLTTLGIALVTIYNGFTGVAAPPELTLDTMQNFHPEGTPIFPIIFFTISCGALSGFHSTQSPMVARTLKSEKEGRYTFYGMMIVEGLIAMVWAGATMAIFDGQTLSDMIAAGTPSVVVNHISILLLGNVIGTLAIIGVIVLPISTGISGFRSLRNILADYLNIPQDTLKNVLLITIPMFAVSIILYFVDFDILWRYFNWANQICSAISLLVSTRYLYLKGKNYMITFIPGAFILYAVVYYIMTQPIGFNLPFGLIGHGVSIVISLAIIALFWKIGVEMKASLERDSIYLNDHLPINELQNSPQVN